MSRAPDLLSVFGKKLLLADGSTGTALEELAPGRSSAFLPLENPGIVEDLHRAYFAAGSDIVETATFGANERALARLGASGQARALNRAACEAAVRAARRAEEADGRPRWVAGSVGPGEDPPSLGASTYVQLCESYRPQMLGLLEGGADLVMIETCQDPLQVKAALGALFDAGTELGREAPFVVSATVDSRGRMLTGTGMEALAAIMAPFRPLALGLNCSGGPGELAAPFESLARVSPMPLCLMPNAGLPRLEAGKAVYPLGPEDFARLTAELARRFGAALVGGCCGTGPAHIRALAGLLAERPQTSPRPSRRARVASLYEAWPSGRAGEPGTSAATAPEGSSPGAVFLRVGERANAAGSAAFSRLVTSGDVEGQAAFALTQEDADAHALDLHLARPGRDEAADLAALAGRLAGSARAALCLDSADPEVLAAALPLVGGRSLLNSANLEDEDKARRVFRLARRFGAAVVCLALDGRGPARTAAAKVEICGALYGLAREEGLAPEDLYFDCLTFSLASETGDLAGSAARTLEALPLVKAACPGSSAILGVGNVSFGLPRPLRPLVTAVFLAAARKAGLDAAILDPGLPEAEAADPGLRSAVETLISGGASTGERAAALDSVLARSPALSEPAPPEGPDASPRDRLRSAILRGEAEAAAASAREASADGPDPGDGPCSPGGAEGLSALVAAAMSEVGARFASGELPLPLVLRSAQAAQGALGALASGTRSAGPSRGTVVLATVKGDLHDIGKNLTGLILAGSGYRVVDLGVDAGTERLLEAARAERPDALGLSGLLTRSLQEMRKTVLALRDAGLDTLLLLGGAAVESGFVEAELAPLRPGRVRACSDAFEALRVLAGPDHGSGTAAGGPVPAAEVPAERPAAAPSRQGPASSGRPAEPSPSWKPPFLGTGPAESFGLEELLAVLDRRTLLQVRWGYGRAREEEAAEAFERVVRTVRSRGLCRAAGVHGYFPCEHRGGGLLAVEDGRGGIREFLFPVERGPAGRTVAAYFEGPSRVIPLFAVTAGAELSRAAAELRTSGAHEEYFRLHGLAASLAEAAAELLHARIGRELVAAGAESAGKRYSFGFPACPGVEAQRDLLALLEADRIGLGVTEGHQLTPEFSVTALVVPRSRLPAPAVVV